MWEHGTCLNADGAHEAEGMGQLVVVRRFLPSSSHTNESNQQSQSSGKGTAIGFAAFIITFSNNSPQISFVRPFHLDFVRGSRGGHMTQA